MSGMAFIIFITHAFLFPCSTFIAKGNNRLLFGRNYDFHSTNGFIVVNPRGVIKEALVFPGEEPAKWISQFGSITFNQVGQEFPTGGMNEKGLVIECMWLSETRYPSKDHRPSIMESQWIQYILDTCETVQKVGESFKVVRIMESGQPLHFLTCDANGNGAIIEIINGSEKMYEIRKQHPAALTNTTYPRCLHYLKGYVGFGGKKKIRRSSNSMERFTQLAVAIKDKNPTVQKAFSWLDRVAMQSDIPGDSITIWSIVYNPKTQEIHFKVKNNKKVHVLKYSDFSFHCTKGAWVRNLKGIKQGNLKKQFIPLTPQLNTELVKKTFAQYKKNNFLTEITDEELEMIGGYPATLKCQGN